MHHTRTRMAAAERGEGAFRGSAALQGGPLGVPDEGVRRKCRRAEGLTSRTHIAVAYLLFPRLMRITTLLLPADVGGRTRGTEHTHTH